MTPRPLLALALLAASAPVTSASCAARVSRYTDCAGEPYARTRVSDADACCALCASEGRCRQWTFHGISRRCARTAAPESPKSGWRALFSTCGVRPAGGGSTWAVIAAGSKGYGNYRHQSDACHAYQVLRAKGVPEDRIIVMAYGDVADSPENPFRGKLFNRPDPDGPGVDVYAGCKIDYRGQEVTPENFQRVLEGRGAGKVLRSTAEDNVFLYFSDHGAPGLIGFPDSELHRAQLQQTLRQMWRAKMFKHLVFYLETCDSGSMFKGMDIPGVYALSAASPDEFSYATYCSGRSDMVAGTSLETCLGDLFSVSWMQDSESHDITKETLQQQFERVKKLTTMSQVEQWGDLSFTSLPLSDFQGPRGGVASPPAAADPGLTAVSARAVDLQRRVQVYEAAESPGERAAAAAAVQAELAEQQEAAKVYARFVELVYPEDAAAQGVLRNGTSPPDHQDCELKVHAAVRTACARRFDANSGFALQFHRIVVNACAAAAEGLSLDLAALAQKACNEAGGPVPPRLV